MRLRPIPIIAVAISTPPACLGMSLTNDLSILRRSIGNLGSEDNEDDRVPKSSNVIVAPSAGRLVSLPRTSGSSSSKVPSVISNSSAEKLARVVHGVGTAGFGRAAQVRTAAALSCSA
jgi:hypothetical protein